MNRLSLYKWSWILAFASFILRLPGFFTDLPPYNFVDEAMYTNGVYSIALSDWGWAPYNYLAGGVNYYIPAIIIIITQKLFSPSFNMEQVIILSRIIGPGILSCLAIPLVFVTGRRLFQNEKIALLAAGILAFSPLMLGVSRIWYPDHYAVIFSTLALYAAARIATKNSPNKTDYILLGIAIGLSASTKYNGLFFALLIPITHGFVVLKNHKWIQRLRHFCLDSSPWIAGLSMIGAFLITNPFVVVSWPRYLEAIQRTREAYLAGSQGLMVANTPVFYTTLLLFTTFGILGGVIILGGTIFLFRRNIKAAIILTLMPVIFVGLMSQYKNAFDRNISVLVPYTALLFAAGFGVLWEKINHRLLTLIFFIVLAEPVGRVILNTIHDFQPDSRQLAADWMNNNIPPHSIIGLGVSVSDKGFRVSLDNKKFKLVELPLLPHISPATCVNYYSMDQWIYQMFGKGKSVFVSPYYSENIFRNTGGYFFKTEHEGIVKWLTQFEEIHRIKGSYYGPDVFIYKRKTQC